MPTTLFRQLCRCNSRNFLAFVALLLAITTTTCAFAKEPAAKARIDINSLMSDTQISSGSSSEMNLVWWVPEEFWLASFQDDASMTAKQQEEFVAMLRPYTLVAVVRGNVGNFGVISYLDEKEIRDGLRLVGTDGQDYAPMAEAKASDEARLLLRMITPMLSNAVGKLGENMRFYLFPARNKAGNRISDPLQPGTMTVSTSGTDVKFRLPLGSLLPPKFDATSGEKFPGNYEFNPYTGSKLGTTAPAATNGE